MNGTDRLRASLNRIGHRPASIGPADCQQPEAPPDLPTTHGLKLVAIEARLARLEQSMNNQNRLLLIGILAIVGDIAQKVLTK